MRQLQSGGIWWRALFLVVVIAGVAGLVTWLDGEDWRPKEITRIAGDADSRELEVDVGHGSCASDPRVRIVEENASEVVLRAEQDMHGDCTSEGLTTTFIVELQDVLGDRAVRVDAVDHPTDVDGPA